MTETLIIDEWTCSGNDLARVVEHQDGTAYVYDTRWGLTAKHGTMLTLLPPTVLAWLIRPLLHEAWRAGCEASEDGANSNDDNPHKDP